MRCPVSSKSLVNPSESSKKTSLIVGVMALIFSRYFKIGSIAFSPFSGVEPCALFPFADIEPSACTSKLNCLANCLFTGKE